MMLAGRPFWDLRGRSVEKINILKYSRNSDARSCCTCAGRADAMELGYELWTPDAQSSS